MLYIFLKKSKVSCYTYFLKFISKFKNTSQIYITMFCFKSFIFTHGTHTCKRKIPYLNFIFYYILRLPDAEQIELQLTKWDDTHLTAPFSQHIH